MRTLTMSAEDIFKGTLLLVNEEHPIKSDGHIRLIPLNEDNEIFLEPKAASLLTQLFQTIRSGSKIIPVSGYRSRFEQELIYLNSLRDNGAAFTEKYVARPDCSEHQTGLAVDLAENTEIIDHIRPSFPQEGVCGDFRNLAAKYGFIERYRQDKEKLTRISHEPWHFRYIGYPHSMIMQEKNLCLEEYIAFLKFYPYIGKHLFYGQTEIFFADAECAAAGLILLEECTQISGNNIDGFIITVWRRKI